MESTTGGLIGGIMMMVPLLMLIFITGVCVVFPFWRIFSRAGFSGALSLLMFIPVVNIVMLFFLAFAQWPKVDAAPTEQGENRIEKLK